MYSLLLVLLATTTVHAASLSLQSPRLTISAADGSQLHSEPLSLSHKVPIPLNLSQTDVLKLTFTVVDTSTSKGVQPHQTFLRFYDPTYDDEGIQPVRVTSGGKAKFELNMAKPPASIPPSGSAPLQVSLLLGSPTQSPRKLELFDLHIPPSLPPVQHPDAAAFQPQPLIHHTFRPDQKLPPKFVSILFSGLTLSPWLVLIGLWSQLSLRVVFAPKTSAFILSLAAFEGLLFWYWIDLKLGQVLAYGGLLGVITLFTGKYALQSISQRRIAGK